MSDNNNADAFIGRWLGVKGSERANYQSSGRFDAPRLYVPR
jgi:hypothetical protein